MLIRKLPFLFPVALLVLGLFFILLDSHAYLPGNVSIWHTPATPPSALQQQVIRNITRELPPEYYEFFDTDGSCPRFSSTYLTDFQSHAASYCGPKSSSTLTCFHRFSGFEGKTDSFCFAQGAVLNNAVGKFELDCSLREFTKQEEMDGLLPFHKLPGYWYETGPSIVFSSAVDVQDSSSQRSKGNEAAEENLQDSRSLEQNTPSGLPSPKTFLLLKREGEGNPWHCLMEVLSTFLTFDILRMPGDNIGEKTNPFMVPGASNDTQVVILDDREDGPYFDLWTLFARRKPVRLSELLDDTSTASNLRDVNLVIPLAGSSNPFWKDDACAQQCTNAPILDLFSRRVLEFYGIRDPPVRSDDDPITLTFIDRRGTRRLQNQKTLFKEIEKRVPHVKIQMVDFAAIPFSEQLRIVRGTDILVGVHGAGLTHSMFMRHGAGAVVEIQPDVLDFNLFRNVAGMRNLGYYRTHAKTIPPDEWKEGDEGTENTMEEGDERAVKNKQESAHSRSIKGIDRRDGWHFLDVEIEQDRLFEVIDAAIKLVYNKGPWKYDMN